MPRDNFGKEFITFAVGEDTTGDLLIQAVDAQTEVLYSQDNQGGAVSYYIREEGGRLRVSEARVKSCVCSLCHV